MDIEDTLKTDIPVLKKCIYFLLKQKINSEKQFRKSMNLLRKKYKISPKKSTLLVAYNSMKAMKEIQIFNNFDSLRKYLTKKKNKSSSGVLVITVLTSPYPVDKNGKKQKFTCKWNCYYCPNEPGQPRSYLHDEPAVLRANRNDFCPIRQFNDRANALKSNGHPVDKIELLVLGGTWSSYPYFYQYNFCRDLFYAANIYWDKNKREPYSLQEEQKINESAKTKIIGLTLETRPDCINTQELKRFRMFGCTRVQIGVQHTDDSILKHINRGHGIKESIDAIRILQNNCFKVDIHLMPDLPGTTYDKDKKMFDLVLNSNELRADQIKIYPHSVVPWTVTKKWLENGKFTPLKQDQLIELIINFKSKIQPWIRLNRIIRDIPNQYISGGNEITNLRQVIHTIMKKRGLKCSCIRCREIGLNKHNKPTLVHRIYKSGGGEEHFLSYETLDNMLTSFIRIRLSNRSGLIRKKVEDEKLDINYSDKFLVKDKQLDEVIFPELQDTVLIRELHVYGQLAPTDIKDKVKINNKSQHIGYGTRLLMQAEKIALANGYRKIAVIAGVGTRNYYRKFGYRLRGRGCYMVKKINLVRYLQYWITYYILQLGLIIFSIYILLNEFV